MLAAFDDKLGIGAHVSLCNFTKEPLYVFEQCNQAVETPECLL